MTKLKQYFSTPKKTALMMLCLLAIVIVLGTGTVFAASAIAEGSSIGAENAKNFAFADAGIDPLSASGAKAEFDYEQGQFIYEVKFMAENSEYEYWIRASDGTVVKKQVEIVTQDGSSAVATAKITLDRAKEIALKDAGLAAADVTFTEEKLDVDDGLSVYDIDFYADNVEYEYEINAMTGDIYSKSKETLVTAAPAAPESSSADAAKTQTSQESANQNSQSGQQQTQNPQTSEASTSGGLIGVDAAKDRALKDAGISASDATFTKAKLDDDDGTAVYDIEFYTSEYEYEYEIDARTGAVISRDMEAAETGLPQQGGNASGYIGTEKAKSIALAHAGATNVTYTKAKLDDDGGTAVYDIEFYTSEYEYEYEIDARTGAVISRDMEAVETSSPQQGGNASGYIGIEKAKSIALAHAGVTDVTYTKAKLDSDDGEVIYEIEFRKDGMEYEYSIRAADGSILEYDLEEDD